MPTKRPFIWAHRGASGYEVENTMSSFRKALDLGADGVETDAFSTADGQVILSHDGVLNGSDGKVPIRSLSLAEMKKDPEGQLIPTFEELLGEFRSRKVPISIDVRDLKTAQEVINLLDIYHAFDIVEICLDTKYHIIKVREMSELATLIFSPAVEWPLSDVINRVRNNLNFLQDSHIKALNLSWKFYTTHPSLRSIIHQEARMLAYAWDVHLKMVMQKMMPLDLDALYTNYPDRLKALIDALPL